MRHLENKDINFLKELSKEMKEQDPLGTASPRLWVIRDTKEIPTSDDYADGYQPFDDDDCEELDSVDLDIRILQNMGEEGEEILNRFIESYSSFDLKIEELPNWELGLKVELLTKYGENIRLVPYIEEVFITYNAGTFLTQKAAQKHILANNHHYTDKVHTYCIHGWRNPEIESLINIIEQIDWEQYRKEER